MRMSYDFTAQYRIRAQVLYHTIRCVACSMTQQLAQQIPVGYTYNDNLLEGWKALASFLVKENHRFVKECH